MFIHVPNIKSFPSANQKLLPCKVLVCKTWACILSTFQIAILVAVKDESEILAASSTLGSLRHYKMGQTQEFDGPTQGFS